MGKKLATEKEICRLIVKQGKCNSMFTIDGFTFCGCDYCPFNNDKYKNLKCVNYSFKDNSKEVVKQAEEFLESTKKKPKSKHLTVRVNKEELAAIKENAAKAQLTVSEFIRTLAIYGEVK